MNKVHVIGIGYKPLDEKAREALLRSESILASKRLFEVFERYEEYAQVKDKVKVINSVDETITFIKSLLASHNATVTLLASGDPMFFGIGRRALEEFGKGIVEIMPDMSSMQLAFARIKESWDDAFLMSLHGGPDPKRRRKLEYGIADIPSLLSTHNKVGILTDKESSPSAIAKILLSAHMSEVMMFICERLGYPDEQIVASSPERVAEMQFEGPNVVILIIGEERGGVRPLRFGLKESDIAHSRGLITKDEVRAVTLHKLQLPSQGVFWDIGAGSGSISLEAAHLCPGLAVYAIEKDDDQIAHGEHNKVHFAAHNITLIKGTAPEALENLPLPDRVFIGGSGGKLEEIIGFVAQIPVRIVVLNAVTLETLNEAVSLLERNGFSIEVAEISVSRSKMIGARRQMSALNPVFIIKGERV